MVRNPGYETPRYPVKTKRRTATGPPSSISMRRDYAQLEERVVDRRWL